uniref:Uncharacterized protein n=1 Tax=Tanacetum cinerariifolium TaxID=118510 RepID=A0A699HPL0_TANCI|nr:hypothetical protein [Tanacetum cinerariifolium]
MSDKGRGRVTVDNSSLNHININLVAAQQVALDNALVAPEKRLKIKNCNARIEFSNPQREETYQVTLDAFKISPCYPAFLITAESLKIFKPTRLILTLLLEKLLPRKQGSLRKLRHPQRNSLVLEKEPAEKPKRAKKPAKKSTTMPTTVVIIRDTPGVSVSKKKAPTKVIELVPNQRFLMSNKITGTDEGTDDDSNDDDSDDVTKDDDDDVDSDVDGDSRASDIEKTYSDDDENPNLNQNEEEEEEYKEDYVLTPDSFEFTDDDEEYEELYKDVNMKFKATEHEEEGKGDVEMTDAGCDDGTQQTTYEQVKDDEYVILTTIHDTQKTEVPLQSSSISSDFANQFLYLDNVLPTDSEVISMMNVKVHNEEPC